MNEGGIGPEVGVVKPVNLRELPVSKESAIQEADLIKQEWGEEKGQALFALKEAGFIDFGEDLDGLGKRSVIFHLDKFISGGLDWHDLRNKTGQLAYRNNGIRKRPKSAVEAMVDIFSDVEGYSNEDYHSKRELNGSGLQPKPLLIIPENNTISPEIIAAIPGYIGAWEVTASTQRNTLSYPTNESGFASEISMPEFRSLAIIYHPSYGDGERINERLRVRYPTDKEGSKKPITGDFFREWRMAGRLSDSPEVRFKEEFPHWYDKGWLREGDFKQLGGVSIDENRAERKSQNRSGMYSLNGVRYILGKDFSDVSRFSVVELKNNELAAIVEDAGGKRVVRGVFRMVDPEDMKDRKYKYVNKNEVNYVSIEGVFNSQDREDVDRLADNFDEFLDFSKKLHHEYQIDYFRLPTAEQVMGFKVFQEFGQNSQFWEYIKKNGEPGLKAFMLACDSLHDVQKTLDIGKLDGSTLLLTNIGLIADLVTTNKQRLEKLTAGEEIQVNLFSDAALDITSELFFSAPGKSPQELHGINNALWEHYRFLLNTYQQYDLGNPGLLAQWIKVVPDSISPKARQALIMGQLREGLFAQISRLPDIRDPQMAEKALTEAVVLLNDNPEMFVDSDIFALADRRVVYRMLARSSLPMETRMRVIGRVLTYANVGYELDTLRALTQDSSIPDSERTACQDMINRMVGIVEGQQATDVVNFYRNFDFASFASHQENMRERHAKIEERLRRHGMTNQSVIRDLGSGLGELVNSLQTQGFSDVRGIDVTPDYVEKAKAQYGDYFEVGDILELPEEQVDAFVLENNVLAHLVGAAQKRRALETMGSKLKLGGIITFDSGNMEISGNKYDRITAYGAKTLEAFGVPQEVARNSGIAISSPNGVQYMTRQFLPDNEWRKLFAGVEGLRLVEVAHDETAAPGDERLIYVLKKVG